MPIYSYLCDGCSDRTEVAMRMTDPAEPEPCRCGAARRRVPSRPGGLLRSANLPRPQSVTGPTSPDVSRPSHFKISGCHFEDGPTAIYTGGASLDIVGVTAVDVDTLVHAENDANVRIRDVRHVQNRREP